MSLEEFPVYDPSTGAAVLFPSYTVSMSMGAGPAVDRSNVSMSTEMHRRDCPGTAYRCSSRCSRIRNHPVRRCPGMLLSRSAPCH